MLKARALFAPLIALNFLFAWPCGAYTGSLPSPSAKERRPVITVGHHRYEDFDNDDDFDDPPPPRRADPYIPPPDAPPFPEFLPPPRPANCGEFRYWNGEYCADAREHPPYVGPRW